MYGMVFVDNNEMIPNIISINTNCTVSLDLFIDTWTHTRKEKLQESTCNHE